MTSAGQIGSRFALTAMDAAATLWMICTLGSVSVSVVLISYAHRTARRSQINALLRISFLNFTPTIVVPTPEDKFVLSHYSPLLIDYYNV